MLTSSQETLIRTYLRADIQPRRKRFVFGFLLSFFLFLFSGIITNIFLDTTSEYQSLLRSIEISSMLVSMVLGIFALDTLFNEKIIIDRGKFVLGAIVQANANLYRVDSDDLPAVVCFSLDDKIRWDYNNLSNLAHRAFHAKSQFPMGERSGLWVGMTLNAEIYQPGRRTSFPKSWTKGISVYMEDIMIQRKSLKREHLQGEPLVCLAASKVFGVILVPHRYVVDAIEYDPNVIPS
jgi:hypothetical protein